MTKNHFDSDECSYPNCKLECEEYLMSIENLRWLLKPYMDDLMKAVERDYPVKEVSTVVDFFDGKLSK